ncbi:MAG: S8 family serine peptidase [Chloroflexi bacterium]|nr:S8 family serine peptidase [Chloroflexota bacterium]
MSKQINPLKLLLAGLFLLLLLGVPAAHGRILPQPPRWQDKVDPCLLTTPATTAESNEIEFLLTLTAQADLSGADALTDKTAKGRYVYEQLTAVAQQTQPPVIARLQSLGAEYRPYWISNMIWVRGDASLLPEMAMRSDVAHLYANPQIALDVPEEDTAVIQSIAAWDNIGYVGAKTVWQMGITGQGAVIGGQDTGYEWSHPALQNSYRGWNGVTADHDYNWHDAIHSDSGAANPCGVDAPAPCDDHGHGTHTMGTMTGNDLAPTDPTWPGGAANPVGMAPGAKWIACRNMEQGVGTPATYTECYEWFIAPYPVGGNPLTDGDPTKAPHVINNSWSCPPSEGCNPDSLLNVVQAVRAAGIVTVHSAGNSGSSCSTVNTPSAIYDESFSVGATYSSDAIAGFSSRGPVTIDSSNRPKPDISAPGVDIYSSYRGGGYLSLSGTSMAGPHVAGLVALIISARPDLAGNVAAIEQIVQDTAVPLTTTQGCGGDAPDAVPNNVYGYGRINALQAIIDITLPYRYYYPVFFKE